jgi:hypothetical protein
MLGKTAKPITAAATQRHKVKNLFAKLKDRRPVATR